MKTQKILFSILAIFAVTMGILLGASPAQATEVIRDGDTALGIRGLTVRFADRSEAVYDVDFVFRSPQGLYGDPPGLFDFSGQGQAEDAIIAANAALNAAGTPLVGDLANYFYSVGYNYLDSALDGPVVRAAQATNLYGLGWPIKDRDLEEISSAWGDPNSYAKFVEVTGAECSDNADCDDGQFCNGAETCNGGQCQDGTGPCAGGEVCVEDSDECIAVECTSSADCDDGQFCNGAETCDSLGQCVAGTPPCEAGEVCMDEDDTCVPPECSENADCDDGRFCNGAETCEAGQCQNGASPCEAGEICLEETDECVAPECSENADCDDGRFCNGLETCVEGRCQDGTRACGAGEICLEISDTCVEAECIIDAQCDDGRFCNGNETCDAGQCQSESTSPCGAGESCEESIDECVESSPTKRDGIIATWSNGLWYWDIDTKAWTQLSADTTKGDLAAADFTADGIADVAAIFQLGPASGPQGPGIYYLNGDSKIWTRIPNSAPTPFSVTAGDITGDGRPEVIASWNVFGIWYWNFAATTPAWIQLSPDFTKGDIAAADFTGDGIADVAASFVFGPASDPQGAGLYYLNGSTKEWTLVPDSASAPFSVTAGDLTADGRPEVIATWSVGIWYWNFAAATPAWTQLTTDTTNKTIVAGNFVRSGSADVAAIFEISPVSTPGGAGLYYLNGVTGAAAQVPDSAPAPFSVTAGDVTGD